MKQIYHEFETVGNHICFHKDIKTGVVEISITDGLSSHSVELSKKECEKLIVELKQCVKEKQMMEIE